MKSFEVRTPTFHEMHRVFYLRWFTLWDHDLPIVSAQDEFENDAMTIHASAFSEGLLASTGRVHQVPDTDGVGQIRYMATNEFYRGRGFGNDILDFLQAQATAAGLEALVLNAREKAVPFYERAGFTAVGAAFEAHGVAHLPMRKDIISG